MCIATKMRVSSVAVLALLCSLCLAWGAEACVNGRRVGEACQCEPGWLGPRCDVCGGRIRLENSSGIIADDFSGMNYPANTQCVFYVEADRPAVSVHLRLLSFYTECQWDYLHVFDGDSVHSPKLAAFTGKILTPESAPVVDSISSGSGMGSGEMVPIPYQSPVDIVLSSSGAQILLYFFSDASLTKAGFEIAYWLDYACPNNCSGNGGCDNGTCVCDSGWSGDLCHTPSCPGDCSGQGQCDDTTLLCDCQPGYSGADCSVDLTAPHWETVDYSFLANETLLEGLPRASHSAVVWAGQMILYGGYRFPSGMDHVTPPGEASGCGVMCEGGSGGGGSGDAELANLTLFRYEFATRSWGVMETVGLGGVPGKRYGHTAVVYNDTMYVFGGSLLPSEEITNELWALDLPTLTWTSLAPPTPATPTTLPNNTLNVTATNISSEGGEGGEAGSLVMVEVVNEGANEGGLLLPVPVRSHTAHVVGDRMVVVFGLSSEGSNSMLDFVQEYDFVSGVWSAPLQTGFRPPPRMGHSSVLTAAGLLLVYGGRTPGNGFSSALWSYQPDTHSWAQLADSGVSGSSLHTAVLSGQGDMLVFAGDMATDCFTSRLLVYHTQCNSWETLEFGGLLGNASRYGHSVVLEPGSQSPVVFGGYLGVLRRDLLLLNTSSECGQFSSRQQCLNATAQLCGWGSQDGCLPAYQQCHGCSLDTCDDVIPDVCRFHGSCSQCSAEAGCAWNSSRQLCLSTQSQPSGDVCEGGEGGGCARFTSCLSCGAHGPCVWARNGTTTSCLPRQAANASSLPEVACPSTCSQLTSCEACTGSGSSSSCLWCPSVQQCVANTVYPISFPFGQCLAWVDGSTYTCPGACESRLDCSSCQGDVRCGWCNDVSDTGLGRCTPGGFTEPLTACQTEDSWNYYQCPACQCNGHSTCVNGSTECEACQDGTTGAQCQRCINTTFGNPRNGGLCQPCDCNGYAESCDPEDGSCVCVDSGVVGEQCTVCDAGGGYVGDADNLCYLDLLTGFIYAFGVDDDAHRQTFLVTTPPQNKPLNFRFDITSNPNQAVIVLQLFLARRSQDLWILANLTDPVTLTDRNSFVNTFFSFVSNDNTTFSQLLTFARPSITDTANFTELFENATENDFTAAMWDGDVTLVVRASNLSSSVSYRVTVDQQDLLFLLYFFATFVICFTVLLGAFLLGWYIKKKVQYRAYVRQQYIELRRRVARPFAKLKLVMDRPSVGEQHPSYVAVETCRDEKTAVLSLFVRLPGDRETGRPMCGRTGICTGSTLVRVNKKSKGKGKGKAQRRHNGTASSRTSESRTVVET